MDVQFPDGTVIQALSISERRINDAKRDYGLYFDPCWAPTWNADLIDWPDHSVPANFETAAEQIRHAFARAQGGERVEVGCIGGLGRTGTALACMAVLAGVPPAEAVEWVRSNFRRAAIENAAQERWVQWFAEHVAD